MKKLIQVTFDSIGLGCTRWAFTNTIDYNIKLSLCMMRLRYYIRGFGSLCLLALLSCVVIVMALDLTLDSGTLFLISETSLDKSCIICLKLAILSLCLY